MRKVKSPISGRQYGVYGDFHTHSTYSGHAMATPEMMVRCAKARDLDFLAITDHVYEFTAKHDIENQKVRPAFFTQYLSDEDITVIGGREMNLFTDNPVRTKPGLNLTAHHSWFGPSTFTYREALLSHEALLAHTHVFCHPERTAVLFNDDDSVRFLHGLCELALHAKHKIHIEINTTSAIYYDAKTAHDQEILQLVLIEMLKKEYTSLEIVMGSDAHCTKDLCRDFGKWLEVLENYDVLDRVINLDPERCKSLLELANL